MESLWKTPYTLCHSKTTTQTVQEIMVAYLAGKLNVIADVLACVSIIKETRTLPVYRLHLSTSSNSYITSTRGEVTRLQSSATQTDRTYSVPNHIIFTGWPESRLNSQRSN